MTSPPSARPDMGVAALTCPGTAGVSGGAARAAMFSGDRRVFSPLGLVALSLLIRGSGGPRPAELTASAAIDWGPRLTKMRIFVVEDEESVACCLQALLLDAGHTPLVLPCVDLALDRFEAAPPDAVLL